METFLIKQKILEFYWFFFGKITLIVGAISLLTKNLFIKYRSYRPNILQQLSHEFEDVALPFCRILI